jgi:hypothetical protein
MAKIVYVLEEEEEEAEEEESEVESVEDMYMKYSSREGFVDQLAIN